MNVEVGGAPSGSAQRPSIDERVESDDDLCYTAVPRPTVGCWWWLRPVANAVRWLERLDRELAPSGGRRERHTCWVKMEAVGECAGDEEVLFIYR